MDQGTGTTQTVGFADPGSVTEPVVTTETMGNVFYVDLNQCALGMDVPQYGAYLRYSPLAQAQRGYGESEGFSQEAPDLTTAKANPKVKLVVLTDEGTFRSAQMLAVWVRDGKLGTVSGRTQRPPPVCWCRTWKPPSARTASRRPWPF